MSRRFLLVRRRDHAGAFGDHAADKATMERSQTDASHSALWAQRNLRPLPKAHLILLGALGKPQAALEATSPYHRITAAATRSLDT